MLGGNNIKIHSSDGWVSLQLESVTIRQDQGKPGGGFFSPDLRMEREPPFQKVLTAAEDRVVDDDGAIGRSNATAMRDIASHVAG